MLVSFSIPLDLIEKGKGKWLDPARDTGELLPVYSDSFVGN